MTCTLYMLVCTLDDIVYKCMYMVYRQMYQYAPVYTGIWCTYNIYVHTLYIPFLVWYIQITYKSIPWYLVYTHWYHSIKSSRSDTWFTTGYSALGLLTNIGAVHEMSWYSYQCIYGIYVWLLVLGLVITQYILIQTLVDWHVCFDIVAAQFSVHSFSHSRLHGACL